METAHVCLYTGEEDGFAKTFHLLAVSLLLYTRLLHVSHLCALLALQQFLWIHCTEHKCSLEALKEEVK